MKNRFTTLWLMSLLCLATVTSAQIHQAGQTTIELSAGLVDGFRLPGQDNFGVFSSLSYSKYKSLNTYWKGTVHLNQKFYAYDKALVPVSQWLGEATYFTRVMGLINRSWVINVGGGVAGGYESINQDRGEVQGASLMNRSEWVVGPTLAIEGEYILTGRTILIARAQEYYLFRSNITPTHFNLGVGIKFILDADSDYK
ncbi:conjugal transfer protein TraO [Spirosoma luteum]|uniref:conjugal transfer protein TraO n=1 Tax=Spirosoma luteum TaxID=431553 RepID=UPI0003A4D0C9|nr:conjugal transfer protein TraO [Spirosoma luteum]